MQNYIKHITQELQVRIDSGDWFRAAGDCLCPICGKTYQRHQNIEGFEWLTYLCTGWIIKT